MSLLQELEKHCREISKATAGKLPCEMSVHLKVLPGDIVTVEYHAYAGDIMGKGVLERKFEYASGPEIAAEKLIDRYRRSDIARKIRLTYLKAMADELGMEVRPTKATEQLVGEEPI